MAVITLIHKQIRGLHSLLWSSVQPQYEQELTFSTLKVYLNKFKVHFDEITFEKTYKLKTKDEKYNRLAEIMADENDVDVKVARF